MNNERARLVCSGMQRLSLMLPPPMPFKPKYFSRPIEPPRRQSSSCWLRARVIGLEKGGAATEAGTVRPGVQG